MTLILPEAGPAPAEAVDPTAYYLCRFARADALRATDDDGEAVGIEVRGLPTADADPGAASIPFRFVLTPDHAMLLVSQVLVEMMRLGNPVATDILGFLLRREHLVSAEGPGHGPP